MRAVENKTEIIYVDETGCFLENNYYRDWISEKIQLLKVPKQN